MKIRVCFLCVEIFSWGKYGGFGKATRLIGRELTKRGFEVFAVVPRRKGQKPVETLDGITVLSFPSYFPWASKKLYEACNADIYHSQEPSLGTYLALKAMPNRKHIVTFIDPRNTEDWKIEFRLASLSKWQVITNYFYEDNFLIKKAVQQMATTFCAAHYLVPKVKQKYALKRDSRFLPTPVEVPETVQKAAHPTVCFLGRLDRRKQPKIFFKLAKEFPHVKFVAVGHSRDEKWDHYLRQTYSCLPNLELKGFINQFSSDQASRILEKSWILANTSAREGLPNSFLEAAAHKCAILSSVNPDEFASRFGYHVRDDDFSKGLAFLLEDARWQVSGNRGFRYVKETFELNHAIDQHVAVYEQILKKRGKV